MNTYERPAGLNKKELFELITAPIKGLGFVIFLPTIGLTMGLVLLAKRVLAITRQRVV